MAISRRNLGIIEILVNRLQIYAVRILPGICPANFAFAGSDRQADSA
jgi:hypothetical protein